MTMERILAACEASRLDFAWLLTDEKEALSKTDDISQAVAFRAGSLAWGFPVRGVTVTFAAVEKWELTVIEHASCGDGI